MYPCLPKSKALASAFADLSLRWAQLFAPYFTFLIHKRDKHKNHALSNSKINFVYNHWLPIYSACVGGAQMNDEVLYISQTIVNNLNYWSKAKVDKGTGCRFSPDLEVSNTHVLYHYPLVCSPQWTINHALGAHKCMQM